MQPMIASNDWMFIPRSTVEMCLRIDQLSALFSGASFENEILFTRDISVPRECYFRHIHVFSISSCLFVKPGVYLPSKYTWDLLAASLGSASYEKTLNRLTAKGSTVKANLHGSLCFNNVSYVSILDKKHISHLCYPFTRWLSELFSYFDGLLITRFVSQMWYTVVCLASESTCTRIGTHWSGCSKNTVKYD